MRINIKKSDSMALPGRGGSISGVIVPAVCVGTAACVVAYIIWGPEQFFRKRGNFNMILRFGKGIILLRPSMH